MKIRITFAINQILSNNLRQTVRCDLETVSYRSPFFWANLPQEWKSQKSLSGFKRKIRQCRGEIYVRRLYKVYEPQVGFL